MRTTVTGSDWHTARECLTKAWFALRSDPPFRDEATRFRAQQRDEIRVRAHALYPRGRVATGMTHGLLLDPTVEVLFGAQVEAAPFSVTVDILERDPDGWHLVCVQPSFANPRKHDAIIDSGAYAVIVLRRAGLRITRTSSLSLSRTFRHGNDADRLFERTYTTLHTLKRADELELEAVAVARALLADRRPSAALRGACEGCAFFTDRCVGRDVEHSVLELPRVHGKLLARLVAAGIVDLAAVPSDIGLNETQERARRAVASGQLQVANDLPASLGKVTWPCHYLDFETVMTFLPLYEGHGCHQQVVTQFSVHHRDHPSAELGHHAYLADPARDCQREIATALIEALGTQGSIVVYSSFEATVLRDLITHFPDLSAPLGAIVARLVDLRPLIEDHVYHPNFRGSFSIKHVLPALVPELSYAGLEIADGGAAITRFARMARGEVPPEAFAATREALLAYCHQDTLAMVRLHEVLLGLVDERKPGPVSAAA